MLLGGMLSLLAPASVAAEADRVEPLKRIDWVQVEQDRPGSIFQFITSRMPDVTHSLLVANATRGWRMVESGAEVCRIGTTRTHHRESVAYFVNTMLHPGVQLLVRVDDKQRIPLNRKGEVDLPRLLSSQALRGAYSAGRSYGETVDQLLQQFGATGACRPYQTADHGSRLLDMLDKHRFDYLVEYQGALEAMESRGAHTGRYTMLPIAGATAPLVVGIACPRTPWGHAAAKAIEQVLKSSEGYAFLKEFAARSVGVRDVSALGSAYEQFFRDAR